LGLQKYKLLTDIQKFEKYILPISSYLLVLFVRLRFQKQLVPMKIGKVNLNLKAESRQTGRNESGGFNNQSLVTIFGSRDCP